MRVFGSFMDWVMRGSRLSSYLKLSLIAGVVFAGAFGPPVLMDHIRAQDFKNRFTNLDKGLKVEFNDAAACVAAGYRSVTCNKAHEEAQDIVTASSTRLHYKKAADCQALHGVCHEKIIPETNMMMMGKTPLYTTRDRTVYAPELVGWQATQKDLKNAVPLYNSAKEGMVFRRDGILVKDFRPAL